MGVYNHCEYAVPEAVCEEHGCMSGELKEDAEGYSDAEGGGGQCQRG